MELKHGNMIRKLTLFEKASLLKGKNVWETPGIDRVQLHATCFPTVAWVVIRTNKKT